MTALDDAFNRRFGKQAEEGSAPSSEYVEEFTVSPSRYTREEKQRVTQQREQAVGPIGLPSGSRAGEIVKEGVIRGTAGLATTPSSINTLVAQGMAALLPVGPVKRMAERASAAEERARTSTEQFVRGLVSGAPGEFVPSPFEIQPGEALPEQLPPETLGEKVIMRGAEFLPETLTATSAMRALGKEFAPGFLGAIAGVGKAAPGAAGAAAGIGTASVIGEEVGGSLGRVVGKEEAGRMLGRLALELGAGMVSQPALRVPAETAARGTGRILKPMYRGSMAAVRRVIDGTALDAFNAGTVPGMEQVTNKLNTYFATREGQRLRIAMEGRNPIQEDIVRQAEKAMADMGLPLTVDLATRTGSKEMLNMLKQLEQKDINLRLLKERQQKTLETGIAAAEERVLNQLRTSKRQNELHLLSAETLQAIEQRQVHKISDAEQQVSEIARGIQQRGANYEQAGAQMRQVLQSMRNEQRIKYQTVYERLDREGDAISSQLDGGGYSLDGVMSFMETLRTQQPTLFDRAHGAIARYDRTARRYLLKEDPTGTADNLPDAGDFPEILDPDEISDSVDAVSKSTRDETAYKGVQEYPAGPIGVEPGIFKPVSFRTMRHLRRDIGIALRSAPPDQKGALAQLQKLIDEEIRTKTPEQFDNFRMVQDRYKTDFVEKYQRGVGGKILSTNREGIFRLLDNDLMSAIWKSGVAGARQARELGLLDMPEQPVLTFALRKLAQSIGKADPTNPSQVYKAFVANNRPFLDETGLTPIFQNYVQATDALQNTLEAARIESKMVETKLLEDLLKAPEVRVGQAGDIGETLIGKVAVPQQREALIRLMSAPGQEKFRDAVIYNLLGSMKVANRADPYEFMMSLEKQLRPLFDTVDKGAFDRAASYAAIVQTRKFMRDPALESMQQSLAAQDPATQAIGTSSAGIAQRARSVKMNYMSKFYAAFDILSRYGFKVARDRASRMLGEAMYDPKVAKELETLVNDLSVPNLPLSGLFRIAARYNKFAVENGMAILLYETGERTQLPELPAELR